MKSIGLKIVNPVLAAAITEQIQAVPDIKIAEGEGFDLLVTDDKNQNFKPSLMVEPPVRIGDLIDRIKYLLSGRDKFSGPGQPISWTLDGENLVFDPQSQNLNRGEKSIKLTDQEKLLLLALNDAPDFKLNRKDLLQEAWGYADTAETHTLETHLYRLRQKLEEGLGLSNLIVTEEGSYRLNTN